MAILFEELSSFFLILVNCLQGLSSQASSFSDSPSNVRGMSLVCAWLVGGRTRGCLGVGRCGELFSADLFSLLQIRGQSSVRHRKERRGQAVLGRVMYPNPTGVHTAMSLMLWRGWKWNISPVPWGNSSSSGLELGTEWTHSPEGAIPAMSTCCNWGHIPVDWVSLKWRQCLCLGWKESC